MRGRQIAGLFFVRSRSFYIKIVINPHIIIRIYEISLNFCNIIVYTLESLFCHENSKKIYLAFNPILITLNLRKFIT